MTFKKPYLEKMLIWYVDLLHKHFERAEDLYNFKGDLFHPGEYGRYREEAAREFIQFSISGRLSTGEGFIIASNNSIDLSTQCDIVVYDKSAPLFRDSHIRFFPMESVAAIGEVKSTLSTIKEVTDALIKLAKNKEIRKSVDLNSAINFREYITDQNRIFYLNKIIEMFREVREENGLVKLNFEDVKNIIKNKKVELSSIEKDYVNNFINLNFLNNGCGLRKLDELVDILLKKRLYEFNPEINHTDHIMSFLICHKITIQNKKLLMQKIEEAYNDNNIPMEDRHNMILSLEDGLFLYYDHLDKTERNIYNWAFPKMRGTNSLKQRFIPKQSDTDPYYHFKVFAKQLFDGTSDITILHPEPARHFNWEEEKNVEFIDS